MAVPLSSMMVLLWALCLQPQLPHLHTHSHGIQPGPMLWKPICKLTPVTLASPDWCVSLLGAEEGWQPSLVGMGRNTCRPQTVLALPLPQSPADHMLGREIRHKIPGAKNSSHKDIHLSLQFQSSRNFNSSRQNFKAR